VARKLNESPKIVRSQSFVSQTRPAEIRGEVSASEKQIDYRQRPRSSDARSDLPTFRLSGANDVTIGSDRGTQSARASVERDVKSPRSMYEMRTGGRRDRGDPDSPAFRRRDDLEEGEVLKDEKVRPTEPRKRTAVLHIPGVRLSVPPKEPLPAIDQNSESDDEDMGDYFEAEIAKAQAALSKLELARERAERQARQIARPMHEAMRRILVENTSIMDMLGPVPEGMQFARKKQKLQVPDHHGPSILAGLTVDMASTAPASSTVSIDRELGPAGAELQPKVEELDAGSGLPMSIALRPHDSDTVMQNASEAADTLGPLPGDLQANGLPLEALPPGLVPDTRGSSQTPAEEEEEEEDDDETEIEEVDSVTLENVREYMDTPPPEDLPRYAVVPWYKDRQVAQSLEQSADFHAFALSKLMSRHEILERQQYDGRQNYKEGYEHYLKFTLSDDPVATKSREFFQGTKETTEAASKPPPPEPQREQGRRAGRNHGTELDIEHILEKSRRDYEEQQKRLEQIRLEKFRSDKEATIPDMYWDQEAKDAEAFDDYTGLEPVQKTLAVYEVLQPVVNFTVEEAEHFEKAYLEFPKQWGNIARSVGRDFKDCIMYYYSMKTELNLKEKLKRQPRKRKKGRGKQRSSALVSELGNTEAELEDGGLGGDGETGERRRPRRAAAPTWGYDVNNANVDSDGNTPAATPARRGAGGARAEGSAEKPEKKVRRRAPKDKEAKVARPAQQMLAPTPPATAKTNRSRSNSRAQPGVEWPPATSVGDLAARMAGHQFEPPVVTSSGVQIPIMPMSMAQPGLASPEGRPLPPGVSHSDVMTAPTLRPEPLGQPPSGIMTFESLTERGRSQAQASSYWSVAETNDFPHLLKAFGTDWASIASHMQTKTAVMVSRF
jgi:hypothetical protein